MTDPHATPKRVTNAELRREAERLAPFSPRARPHATPDRVRPCGHPLGAPTTAEATCPVCFDFNATTRVPIPPGQACQFGACYEPAVGAFYVSAPAWMLWVCQEHGDAISQTSHWHSVAVEAS